MQRTFQLSDVRVATRDDDTGHATISGCAVPFGVDINYAGQVERFAPGSIDPDSTIGRPLMYGHDYGNPAAWLGTITAAHADDTGLHVDAQVVDPAMAAKLRAAATPPGLSVGVDITAARHETDASVTHLAATLRELSVTPIPAYGDHTLITAVRQTPTQEEPVEPTPTVDGGAVVELAARVEAIELRATTPAAPPVHLAVRDAFVAGVADYARTRQTRALADVVSAGNAGVLPPDWLSEVVGWYNDFRYLTPRCGSLRFPTSGYTLTVPKITQHTEVGPRGTEKTEVPSRALQTSSTTYTAQWFSGAVDIALELIEQSDPAILGLVVDDLRAQYAAATEDAVVTAAEAAATAAGGALPTNTYAAFVAKVVEKSEAIRSATGTPGNRLAVTTTDWVKVLGLVDSDGRRVFATTGPSNADGSASLVAESVDVGGITVFPSPFSTQSLQFNEMSLRVAEKPPMQLSADNVALMGRDVGILGAVLVAPLYPAGIVKYG